MVGILKYMESRDQNEHNINQTIHLCIVTGNPCSRVLCFTSNLSAQLNGLFFDKSRCQIQELITQESPNIPGTFINNQVNEFCEKYLQSFQKDSNTKMFIWKKVNQTYRLLRQRQLSLPISFPIFSTGHYIISTNDLIKPLFIDIHISSTNTRISIFYNCVVHY